MGTILSRQCNPLPVERQNASTSETLKPSDEATSNQRAIPHLDAQERALVKRLMAEYPLIDQLMAETIVWDYFRKKEAGVAHLDEAEAFAKAPSCKAEAPTGGWCMINDPPPGTPPDEGRSPPPTSAQRSDRSGTSVD